MRFALLLAALLAACASRPAPHEEPVAAVPESNGSHAEEPADRELMDQAEQDAQLRREFNAVMFKRHMTLAGRYHRAGELERALEEVRRALVYRPGSEEAQRLRSQILFEQGARAGQVWSLMDDAYVSHSVKLEERKLTIRRLLRQAERFVEVEDYRRARASYERALVIARDDRRLQDDDLDAFAADAEARLRTLDDRAARARAARERKDIEDALERIENER